MADVRTLILPTDEDRLDRTLVSLFSEVGGGIPDMVRADGETFAIILADPSDGVSAYRSRAIPPGTTAVLAIGDADQAPAGGTFALSYGGTPTGALDFNSPAAIAAAISSASLNPATVQKVGSDYIIDWTTPGARTLLSVDVSLLSPLCVGSVFQVRAGSASANARQILTLAQAPLAATSAFDPLPGPGYTLTNLQTGVADPNGLPSIQQITLSPSPYDGSFTVDGRAIPVAASDQQFANAYGNGVSVVKTGDFTWQFTQGANGPLTSTVSVANVTVLAGMLMTLNLSTIEFLLRFAQSTGDSITTKISLRVTFPGQLPRTYLLTDVDVYRSVINPNNITSAAPYQNYPDAANVATVDGTTALFLTVRAESGAGSVSATSAYLDGKPTVGLPVGKLADWYSPGAGRVTYGLFADGSSDATATGATAVPPLDYNASTNARKWYQVG